MMGTPDPNPIIIIIWRKNFTLGPLSQCLPHSVSQKPHLLSPPTHQATSWAKSNSPPPFHPSDPFSITTDKKNGGLEH